VSPTTDADTRPSPAIAEGVFRGREGEAIILAKSGTDYRIELIPASPLDAAPGAKLRGEIRVQAARMDVITSGGRYIEPIEGPPRRVAGRIVAIDEAANRVVVNAGPFPVVCTPHKLQNASQFRVDQLVTMGVSPGAEFHPAPERHAD
jgi:hypothetical protein